MSLQPAQHSGSESHEAASPADEEEYYRFHPGATVTVSVTNNGGTADVRCVMLGNDGQTYYQDYLGIGPIGDDLWFRFTVDGSHLVFE